MVLTLIFFADLQIISGKRKKKCFEICSGQRGATICATTVDLQKPGYQKPESFNFPAQSLKAHFHT